MGVEGSYFELWIESIRLNAWWPDMYTHIIRASKFNIVFTQTESSSYAAGTGNSLTKFKAAAAWSSLLASKVNKHWSYTSTPPPPPAYGLHRGLWISVTNSCASYLHFFAYFGMSILNRISQSLYRDQLTAESYGVRIPVEERDISLLSNVQPGCVTQKGWGVRLTTHFHLLPRWRTRGAMPLLPLYSSMAWTGKSLAFPHQT